MSQLGRPANIDEIQQLQVPGNLFDVINDLIALRLGDDLKATITREEVAAHARIATPRVEVGPLMFNQACRAFNNYGWECRRTDDECIFVHRNSRMLR